ncbi:uncharacterized protein LOC128242413 isoform X2 [Mya arenaria]|uniref:uncharacterized protein LOC128242413 isoform X2 n=1 Tax=Mya arenaria TaxID=6604 RepID=UPI0022DF61EC|nr:uncharacterized protein LOC128242413 isoform X2 [Mya arenaria]
MWLLYMMAAILAGLTCLEARRYRYCSEGCCPEEYCAYKLICYPKIHCSFGCPDDNLAYKHRVNILKEYPRSNEMPQLGTKTIYDICFGLL